jgi:hypothetical protein
MHAIGVDLDMLSRIGFIEPFVEVLSTGGLFFLTCEKK